MIHYQLITLIFRNVVTFIYGGWFIYIGIQHFIDPDWFRPIVPQIIGYPVFWVYISGIFEIILGILIIIPSTRKVSSIGFIVFLMVGLIVLRMVVLIVIGMVVLMVVGMVVLMVICMVVLMYLCIDGVLYICIDEL